MVTLMNLGWGNLAESPYLQESNPLALASNIGRLQGVVQFQTEDAVATDVVIFYPPGILEGSGMACMADVVVRVMAMKDDNSVAGSWHKGLSMKWSAAGAPTVIGAEYDLRAEQGASGYVVTLLSFGTGTSLRITGAAETVNWVIEWAMLSLDYIA